MFTGSCFCQDLKKDLHKATDETVLTLLGLVNAFPVWERGSYFYVDENRWSVRLRESNQIKTLANRACFSRGEESVLLCFRQEGM